MQRAEGDLRIRRHIEARIDLELKLWNVFYLIDKYMMAAVMGSRMASALASGSRTYTGIRGVHSSARVASHENPLVGKILAMQAGS
jgi:hypothetical protein